MSQFTVFDLIEKHNSDLKKLFKIINKYEKKEYKHFKLDYSDYKQILKLKQKLVKINEKFDILFKEYSNKFIEKKHYFDYSYHGKILRLVNKYKPFKKVYFERKRLINKINELGSEERNDFFILSEINEKILGIVDSFNNKLNQIIQLIKSNKKHIEDAELFLDHLKDLFLHLDFIEQENLRSKKIIDDIQFAFNNNMGVLKDFKKFKELNLEIVDIIFDSDFFNRVKQALSLIKKGLRKFNLKRVSNYYSEEDLYFFVNSNSSNFFSQKSNLRIFKNKLNELIDSIKEINHEKFNQNKYARKVGDYYRLAPDKKRRLFVKFYEQKKLIKIFYASDSHEQYTHTSSLVSNRKEKFKNPDQELNIFEYVA